MTDPYRHSAAVRESGSNQLECRLGEGDAGWLRNVFIKSFLTIGVCVFLTTWNAGLAAIPAAIAGVVWIARDLRRRGGARVLFTVTLGCVHIDRPGDAIDVTLDDLEDVQLDTKAAAKTVAYTDGVHRPFGIGTTSSMVVDVSRIELLLRGDRSIVLDEEYVSTTLITEQLRAIRLFLRRHGWKPLDERDAAESA